MDAVQQGSVSPGRRGFRHGASPSTRGLLLALLAAPSMVSAQAQCISLDGSRACPAFEAASVTTGEPVAGFFPFMRFVSDRESFDREMLSYIRTQHIRDKFENDFGCGSIDLTDTAEYYARFSTSVMCNALVQNSKDACSLSDQDSRPLCAETCAQYGQSEALITSDTELCPNPGDNLMAQLRADFINCALPDDALVDNCIRGITNEPNNCGFGNSTMGLCTYCASGGINSTDTCCYGANVDDRCADVTLPSIIPSVSFDPPSPTGSPSSTNTAEPSQGDDDDDNESGGLSGGAIAGIVIGAIAGAILIAALVFLCLMCYRRRRKEGSQDGSVFNRPSTARKSEPVHVPMEQPAARAPPPPPQNYDLNPGGRVARMSALEASSEPPSSRHTGMAAVAGAGAGYVAGRRKGDSHSSSDFGSSPDSGSRTGVGILRPPPTNIRRNGSLSSGSVLATEDPQSPTSAGGMSSPQGMASQQSEQLPFFKDYYSSEDIHPGDRVAVLWAYQPRAPDEFALERGDMLKIVGIWDDGWATGIIADERADEWDARRQAQRDSGVSNTSGRRDASPPVSGEIKAFPLVCVCLPDHWRKTIEGDGSTESGS